MKSALSPVAIQLERDLAARKVDPMERLRSELAKDDCKLDVVCICLHTYRNTHLSELRRPGRIPVVKERRAGGATLLWLLEDPRRWARVLNRDRHFMETVCYYVVAERLRKYIIRLLELACPEGIVPGWRGLVLRSLIRAKLNLTDGHTANETLDLYFSIREQQTVDFSIRTS